MKIFQVVFRRVTVHVNLYFQHFVIFIISFVRMKESKEHAKQSIIKMYNVSDCYEIIDKVGRGTYGTVYKAKGIKDGRFYAIKKLQNNDTKLQQEGFPITALREITLLKQIDHPNIIKLKEIIVSRPNKRNLFRGSTFLVFEYMDHDFAGLFKMKCKFSLPEIKCIVSQLLEGVAYLHRNKIFHRDIKSANILLNDQGEVKLADFGLGRKIRFQNFFTYKVVTLWYRAPQLLLGSKTYTDKLDVWSVGCVVVQFFTGQVLFKKQTEYSQMQRIYEIVGDFEANQMKITDQSYKVYQNLQDLRPRKSFPKEIGNYLKKICPNMSEVCIDFITRLLHLDPTKRMSCEEALRHPFFSEKPLACNKNQIQKMEYQCHEMFKDRSMKIQRLAKHDEQIEGKGNKFKQVRQNRQSRDNRDLKEKKDREKSLQPPKYSKNYKDDKQYKARNTKGRSNRPYYDKRKDSKYRSSDDNSSYQKNSDSYSSSSRSSDYSSSSRSRSARSRHNDRRNKEETRKGRDDYRGNRDRDHYPRKDDKRSLQRKDKRRDERRDSEKFERQREPERKDKDRHYKNEKDQRYSGYRDYRRKDERSQGKRQYRDERPPFKKDDKVQERRDEKQDKQRKEEKRGGSRDQRKHYRQKRGEWKRDSKQRKYDRSQKPAYESRGRYYEDRDYNRRQQKRGQKSKGDEKYQESQKHGDYYRKDDGPQRKVESKYYFVSGKDQYRKKDYRHSNSSQRSSNHRYKKEREYSRKPLNYQRKNHYKHSHSDSNDRRNH